VLTEPLRAQPLPWRASGRLQGVSIDVVGTDPEVRGRTEDFLAPLVADGAGPPDHRLEFALALAGPDGTPVPNRAGRPLFRYWNLACHRDGRRLTFSTADGSTLTADVPAGRGWGHLSTGLLAARASVFTMLLLAPLMEMFKHRGFFPIHAAALVRDGLGHLFVGRGGSGKTTVALGLIKAGYQYLADDKVLLSREADGVTARAVSRRFNIDPEMARHYPELDVLEALPPLPQSDKRALDVSELYPRAFAARCRIGVVVHVRRTPGATSRLVRLSPTDAFLELTRHTVVSVERPGAVRQLALLRDLVHQSRHYRLENGDDLHGAPDRLDSLLAGA
jgi:hypothetical protein